LLEHRSACADYSGQDGRAGRIGEGAVIREARIGSRGGEEAMACPGTWGRLAVGVVLATVAGSGLGCRGGPSECHDCQPPRFDPCNLPGAPVPKELNKVSLPPYVIETPDVLMIDAIRVVPLPPYRVEPHDVLYLDGRNVFETDPISGRYAVEADGTINLGRAYGGTLRVADLTTEEIRKAVQNRVREFAKAAEVTVSLALSRGSRQVAGRHVVRPDGTIGLGSYGGVYVAGMTLAQAEQTIEAHLAKYLYKPEVAIEVCGFNSKFYYVITDRTGSGEQVVRLPHTGNETVLDALSNVAGVAALSDKKIWVARPAPAECGQDQILPVDWCGITRRGQVKTNYQLLPGDRVYVLGHSRTRPEGRLTRAIAPVSPVVP
jgi:protein involved in polysaccharide export with SLBB domain